MAIDFPTSPTTGQTVYLAGNAYTWDGTKWWTSTGKAAAIRQVFTAGAGQTSYTVTGGYFAGTIDVYLNGVKLVSGDDYTATNGTTITLTSGATAGDVLEVVSFNSFSIANMLPLTGGTLTGGLVGTTATFSGNVSATGAYQVNGKKAVNGPAVAAYLPSNQSASNGVWTKIQLSTEEFDTDNAFDAVTNYRFTPQVEGYYQVVGKLIALATTTASSAICGVYKNGALFKQGPAYISTGTNSMYAGVDALVYLNGSSDYIELWGVNSGTGTNTFTGGQSNTYFSAIMVRGA